MRRARLISIGGAVIAVLLGWLAASSPAAYAQTDSMRDLDVIVVDSSSVREMEQAVPLTLSLVGLMATRPGGAEVLFIDTYGPGQAVGPFAASDSNFASTRSRIEDRLGAGPAFTTQSVVEALEEALSELSAHEAPEGSTIYVALGGAGVSQFDELSFTVAPLLSRFAEKGWIVHGLHLESGDPLSMRFLETITRTTGGSVFSLSSGTDLKPLAGHILGFGAESPVQEIASRTLANDPLSSSRITIVPGTAERTLYFYKDSPAGSFQLVNPSGALVSNVDGLTSRIVETEHLVIWRLSDPVAGNWKVETLGVNGDISVWSHVSDRYDLVLRMPSPVATGEPNSIIAYASQEGRTAVLKGVRLFATITSPDSSVKSYELFDDGSRGDSKAGDGYFTATLPSLEVSGAYAVNLELQWLGFDSSVSSMHSFEAQPFPAFHVESISVRDLVPGEARNIGTVSIHLDGGPFAVDPSEIDIGMATSTDEPGTLELVPHRLFGNGPAWQYDILFTPKEFGSHTLQFNLSLDYAGRVFTKPSSSIAITTVSPDSLPVTIAPAVVEPKPASAAPEPGAAAQVPVATVPVPSVPQGAFPWLVVAVLVVVAIPIAAGVAYFLTRPKPYGYIYTETDDELVDFSNLERRPVFRFFYRGLIRGSELNIPGFEGLVFHFMKDRIDVKSFGEHSTVRVNNQPLIDSATIGDKTWIGTGGKLYTFLNSPMPPPEPSGAD